MSGQSNPLDHFHAYGYAIFEDKVALDLINLLRREYLFIPESDYLKNEFFWYRKNLSSISDTYKTLALNDYFPDLAARLIGAKAVRLLFDQIVVKPSNYDGTPWHQDQPSLCIDSYGICTFWIPLENLGENFGTIQYASNEERLAQPEAGVGFDVPNTESSSYLQKKGFLVRKNIGLTVGDFTVHDGWAVHRAEPNTSKFSRPAINLVYYDADARIEVTNRNWKASRDKFFPGLKPGDIANSRPIAK